MLIDVVKHFASSLRKCKNQSSVTDLLQSLALILGHVRSSLVTSLIPPPLGHCAGCYEAATEQSCVCSNRAVCAMCARTELCVLEQSWVCNSHQQQPSVQTVITNCYYDQWFNESSSKCQKEEQRHWHEYENMRCLIKTNVRLRWWAKPWDDERKLTSRTGSPAITTPCRRRLDGSLDIWVGVTTV